MSETNENLVKEALGDLDALVSGFDSKLSTGKRHDAIDAVLSGAPRTTAVQSLRDHETIALFRQEVTDGLIRVDTARQLLGLIRTVADLVMK